MSTTAVTDITQTTAVSGGNITSIDGVTVTARCVCWSIGPTPTISDNKTEDGTGGGSFTSNISGLEPNMTYYVRAYATNGQGAGYGAAISFKTQEDGSGSSFTDRRDGNVYQTVTIGTQLWMAENLAYAPFSGNYWAYNNDNNNVATYGYLYDWQTAMNVCPVGWHLPSDAEWTELTDYLGGESVAGGKLKATGTTHWYGSPIPSATNETGFTALPGGSRGTDGGFYSMGQRGYWWSATENGPNNAWYRHMHHGFSHIYRNNYYKEIGLSVRCLRD